MTTPIMSAKTNTVQSVAQIRKLPRKFFISPPNPEAFRRQVVPSLGDALRATPYSKLDGKG